MIKYLSIFWLLLVVVISTQAADVNVQVKIEYSRSADIFEVMDNVSNWWPGFTEEEYSKYWQKEFGFSTATKLMDTASSRIRFC